MGAGASSFSGIDIETLQKLEAELTKPVDLSDLEENANAKEEVQKIRSLFAKSGLENLGSDTLKLESAKPNDCSDVTDDGRIELVRLRSLLREITSDATNGFTDIHFPPNASSICLNKEDDSSIEWKRLDEFMDQPYEIFPGDEPSFNSVKQSSHLGNCYFIATLSALCERKEYIKNLFRGNTVEAMKSGRYTVKIYHAGRFHDIHLDSYFPITSKTVTIDSDENDCKLVDSDDSQSTKSKEITSLYFGRNTKGKGIWVPLLEKAYAKVYNSYGAIKGGDIGEALRDLTGSPVFSWRLDHKEGKGMIESGVMWRKLCNAHENKDVSIMKYFFGLVLIM